MGLIQPLICTWEKCISGLPFAAELYSRPYRQVVEKEIALAEINGSARVLNIGCGAVPFTAIHLVLITGAEVWAQDRDPQAVKRAELCVQNAGLKKKVRVFEGDGSKAIPTGFDIALVALQAEPKLNILHNLLAALQPGGRIVFRLPSPKFKNHYDSLPESIPFAGDVRHGMQTFDRSVLLFKPPEDKGGRPL